MMTDSDCRMPVLYLPADNVPTSIGGVYTENSTPTTTGDHGESLLPTHPTAPCLDAPVAFFPVVPAAEAAQVTAEGASTVKQS